MGDSDLDGHQPTPKLPIFLTPLPKPPEPPGLLTPPLHPGASVPFHWEEVPGRPLPCLSRSPCQPPAVSSCSKRCLDLPPRLLHDKQSAAITMTNHVTIPSPTSILEDPYSCPGNRLASTWSFRRVGSRETMLFGSTRWASLSFWSRVPRGGQKGAAGISLEELFHFNCDQDATGNDDTKAKITRVRRSRSFLSLSPKNFHLWASMYEGLKQVVPWRRRPTITPEAEAKKSAC